jgi:hypothetical protein
LIFKHLFLYIVFFRKSGAISKEGSCAYFTTENKDIFNQKASQFLGIDIVSEHVILS